MSLMIERIPAFTDNYFWLFHQPGERAALVVDPGDAAPVELALARYNLDLAGILVTHHHADHIGGIGKLLQGRDVPVYGPASIDQVSRPVAEGDSLNLAGTTFNVMAVPGHTLNHIAFFAPEEPLIFCGDTLFAGGCGRLFEGTPQQMWRSLSRIAALPAETRVYCAHEYTESNLRFACAVEPDNTALKNRAKTVHRLRLSGEATVPSTLAEELATNPFLRAGNDAVRQAAMGHAGRSLGDAAEVFRVIRQWKDQF